MQVITIPFFFCSVALRVLRVSRCFFFFFFFPTTYYLPAGRQAYYLPRPILSRRIWVGCVAQAVAYEVATQDRHYDEYNR